MKRIFTASLAGVVLGVVATWFVLRPHPTTEHAADEAAEHEQSKVSRRSDGAAVVKLSSEQQTSAGLQLAPVAAGQLRPRSRLVGRVLDAAMLAQQSADATTSQVALTASLKEHQRLKALYAKDQNASARSVETAEAAWRRDETLAQAARWRLVSTWGKAIAERPDLDAFVHSLVSLDASLIRLELPLGQSLPSSPGKIEVAAIGAEDHLTAAEFLGVAPTIDPLTQGQGVYCLQRPGRLMPGAPVIGFIEQSDVSESGVVVLRTSLVRIEGGVFVYEQTGKEEFTRIPVVLDEPLSGGWFVRGGLKPGAVVVVSGAQSLLSEELKGRGGEE